MGDDGGLPLTVVFLSPLQPLFRSDTQSLSGAIPRGLSAYSYPYPLVLAGMALRARDSRLLRFAGVVLCLLPGSPRLSCRR